MQARAFTTFRKRLPKNVLTALMFQLAEYDCSLQAVGNERRIPSLGINQMVVRILPVSTQRSTIDHG